MKYIKSYQLFEAINPKAISDINEFENTINNTLEGFDFSKWFTFEAKKPVGFI